MRTFAVLIMVAVCLAAAAVSASESVSAGAEPFFYDGGGRRDPFWPLVTESGSIIRYDDEVVSASDMLLQGILTGDDENVAVMNGRILKAGDMVGAFRIEEVLPTHIVLDNGGEKIEVYLRKEE